MPKGLSNTVLYVWEYTNPICIPVEGTCKNHMPCYSILVKVNFNGRTLPIRKFCLRIFNTAYTRSHY